MTRYSLLFLLPFALLACGDKDGDDSAADDSAADDSAADDSAATGLAIVGDYTDNYGGDHKITEDTWTMGSASFHISQYDNDEMWVVAQNDSANEYNPDLWSRMDWTWSGSDLYFCQTAYDAADEAAALSTTPANAADLAAGCGGFGWSQLVAN